MAKVWWVARPNPTRAAAWGLAALALLAGCQQASPYGSGPGSSRATTGRHSNSGVGGSQGTSASTGAAGTGAASSTGSGSGSTGGAGTTTGQSCPSMPDTSLTDCDAGGLLEVRAVVVDSITGNPPTQPVQLTNADQPGQTAQSGDCGALVYCVPPGSTLSPEVQVNSYLPTIVNQIRVDRPEFYSEVLLLSSRVFYGFVSGLQPAFDATQGSLLVRVSSTNLTIPCNPAGWSFNLYDLDGGAVSPGGVAYGCSIGLCNGGSGTASDGVALLYDLRGGGQLLSVVGVQDGGSAAGHLNCVDDRAHFQFTGKAVVEPGSLSAVLFDVTDAG